MEAALPITEPERVKALLSYQILDTACESTFDDLAALAAKLIGTPIAMVSLTDSDRQWFKARVGLDATEVPRDIAFCAHAILDPDHVMVVPDATADPRFSGNILVTGAPDVRFYAGAPLVNPEGHVLGTLCVIDREARQIDLSQQDTLAALARAVVTTLELRRTAMHVGRLALTDALTGLANRRALVDRLQDTIAGQGLGGGARDGGGFGLVYLDLDGFKRVNDLLGHAAGDLVLVETADALREVTSSGDMVARMGGDEFCVLLPRTADIALLAERMRLTVHQRMAALQWQVTVSVGAVSFPAPPHRDSDALAAADSAMYAAKFAGKNRMVHRVFANRAGDSAA